MKAEAAEADKAATANTEMKDFVVTIAQFAHDDIGQDHDEDPNVRLVV